MRIQRHAFGLILHPLRRVLESLADKRGLERGVDGRFGVAFPGMGGGYLRGGRVIGGGEVVLPAVDCAAVEGLLKYGVDDLSRV